MMRAPQSSAGAVRTCLGCRAKRPLAELIGVRIHRHAKGASIGGSIEVTRVAGVRRAGAGRTDTSIASQSQNGAEDLVRGTGRPDDHEPRQDGAGVTGASRGAVEVQGNGETGSRGLAGSSVLPHPVGDHLAGVLRHAGGPAALQSGDATKEPPIPAAPPPGAGRGSVVNSAPPGAPPRSAAGPGHPAEPGKGAYVCPDLRCLDRVARMAGSAGKASGGAAAGGSAKVPARNEAQPPVAPDRGEDRAERVLREALAWLEAAIAARQAGLQRRKAEIGADAQLGGWRTLADRMVRALTEGRTGPARESRRGKGRARESDLGGGDLPRSA